MRLLHGMVLAIFLCCSAMAQIPQKSLADEVAISRTIITKLDHATQNDPPPNFASEILVRVHKQAATFIELADTTSEELRKGQAPDATSLFLLYTEFLDLYDQYDYFVNFTSKRIELETVRSVATAKEFAEAKTYLDAATLTEISKLNEMARGCKSANRR